MVRKARCPLSSTLMLIHPAQLRSRLLPQSVQKKSCSGGDQQPTLSHLAWGWKVTLVSQLPTQSLAHQGKAIAVSLRSQARLTLILLPTSTNDKPSIQMTVRHEIWYSFPMITEARTDDFSNTWPDRCPVCWLTDVVKAETSFFSSSVLLANGQVSV